MVQERNGESLMLSCKEVSLLTSRSMDSQLTLAERLAVRFHLFYCRGCTRFREQVRFLRRLARRSTETQAADSVRLPEAARERIRAALQRDR